MILNESWAHCSLCHPLRGMRPRLTETQKTVNATNLTLNS